MDFFLLILGILFMGLGFVVPAVIDCGVGSIGLFIFGLIGLYFFVTNIMDAFGENGKAMHATIDGMISTVFEVLFDSSAAEQVYYNISVAGSILVGGFLTLWTIGLGWLTISLFQDWDIQTGLMSGLLCIATIAPGPVKLFKGLRELGARVRRLVQNRKDEKKKAAETTDISQPTESDEIAETTTVTYLNE